MKKNLLKILVTMALLAAMAFAASFLPFFSRTGADFESPMHIVSKGPLDIVVTATGTIQSRHAEVVRSMARGRNTIIWIIDEGKFVTNGQLVVSLDSSEIEKERDQQEITVANSEAALVQAKEKLEIANIDKESKISQAELKLMLAKMAYEKFYEGEYPQRLQDAESKIAVAQEELERAREALGWTKKLADEGFVTRRDLQADELSVRQKQISLDAAVTAMNLLTNYTAKEQRAKLTSDVDQSERELDRAVREARSIIAQAQSTVEAKEQEHSRQIERLESLNEQINLCRITAPTNGLAIYASTMQASRRRWGGEPLKPGMTVYQRQDIMFIPVSGDMIVQFSVQESDLSKLKTGQSATITVDALPDFSMGGTLSKIGLLPDGQNAWLNPDMNVYNCEISIDKNSASANSALRAGMNCNVSMLIASYPSVVSVPMQCVLRVGGSPVVFVQRDGKPVPKPVKIGYDNGRVVHVMQGLEEGEEIMLAPPLSAAEKKDEPASAVQNPAAEGE